MKRREFSGRFAMAFSFKTAQRAMSTADMPKVKGEFRPKTCRLFWASSMSGAICVASRPMQSGEAAVRWASVLILFSKALSPQSFRSCAQLLSTSKDIYGYFP